MKKYFSLIELLIVFAIIAVLSAMLLPALNSAREKAKAITCISNMKQSSLCIAQYSNDNNDTMMMLDTSSFWLSWAGWLVFTGYMNTTDTISFCPSSDPKPPAENGSSTSNGRDRWAISEMRVSKYAYTENFKGCFEGNPTRGDWSITYGGDTNQRYIDLKRVTRLSDFFLIGDITTATGGNHARWYWYTNHYFWRIHSPNAFNLLFADGHAEAKSEYFIRTKIHPNALFR